MSTELEPISTPVTVPSHASPTDLIETWLAGRKPSTIEGYRKDLNDFSRYVQFDVADVDSMVNPFGPSFSAVDWFLSRTAPAANQVVLGYRNRQLELGKSSATIARRLAAIRSLTKLARMVGRIVWTIEVEAPKREPRCDMRGPSEEGLKKLVKVSKKAGDSPQAKRDRAILALLATYGLRRCEVTRLDLADVDFAGSKLWLLRKGNRERTYLELPSELSALLAAWVAVRGPHEGPLFHDTRTGRKGARGRLAGETIRRIIAGFGEAAKLPETVRPHGLRHSVLTTLLASGESVRAVKGLSGHVKTENLDLYDDRPRSDVARLAKRNAKILR